jgi:hydroxymethylbilane synthase
MLAKSLPVTDLPSVVRIGTRGSALALKQTAIVADLLGAAWPNMQIVTQVISTYGDQVTDVPLPQMGQAGVFTSSLEAALRAGAIDLAVHSVKDLPVQSTAGAVIGAMPRRGNPADALISRDHYILTTLPSGAKVGTSSRRRAAQIKRTRPDIHTVDIRGNADTRLSKALDPNGLYDAIVLACAGLERLGRLNDVSEILPLDVILPAPGQAALGVQCRDEKQWLDLLKPINHDETVVAVTAERAFLAGLGGGCSLPVAAYGQISGNRLTLRGRVISPEGTTQIEAVKTYSLEPITVEMGQQAGTDLAERVLEQGAKALLEQP